MTNHAGPVSGHTKLNMKKLFLVLLLHFLVEYSLSAPQAENSIVPDYDYSSPGETTEECYCVPYYQCKNGSIVTDGAGIINARKKTQEEEMPLDEKYLPPECGPYHVCCSNPESGTTAMPYEHRCGARNPSGINGRILSPQVSGEAEFGEWPWQAAILKTDGNSFFFKCGGTLIDELHVITVAHCADKFGNNRDSMVVRLGEWDAQNVDEFLEHEDYKVAEIIKHPNYRPVNLFNDLAILKLNRSVTFKPHIDTACLPQDDDDFTGHNCTVTGWGTNAYIGGAYSVIMKEVSVPVISNEECESMLRKTRLGRFFKLHGNFLCAGGKEGEDSCKGDGGGPLVCYRSDNSYTVAGLVSWGIDCGQSKVPGVYVNLKNFIDWIASKTNRTIDDYWSKPLE